MDVTISEIGETQAQQSAILSFYKECLMATLDDGSYFELSDQTLSSLDILPKFKNGKPEISTHSRTSSTVYSVLNCCRTAMGPRLLALWLKNPLIIKEKTDLRLDIVEYLVQNPDLRTLFYDNELRKIADVMRVSYLMTTKNGCKIDDLVKIFRSWEAVKSIHISIKEKMEQDSNVPQAITRLCDKLVYSCRALEPLINYIDASIYVDKTDADGQFMIKPGSNEDISKVFVELDTLMSSARQQLKYAAKDLDLEIDKTIKLESDADKGFSFKITRQKEQCIRDNSNYHQVNTVKKDGYRFSNKALSRLSDKYVSVQAEYNHLSKDVVKEIIENSVVHQNEVQDFSVMIALLDVFTGLSNAAVSGNYCRPILLDQEIGKIKLDAMRHPCLENQPDIENYVPNDISLSKDSKKFYLITGPNMGGKSTFIKAVAINVLMAQCGSLIPAESACVSVTDGIYTRVGAGDRQMDGISTFMEEMLDMSQILKKATENSLVIIDELGRGTSTFDGFGLSWAISKKLAEEIKCFTLFATHFHELTELESLSPTVGNLHVKAYCDDDKLVMLFSVEKGVCGQSYGINVAKYTKFPEHIVKLAEKKLYEYEVLPGFVDKKESSEFLAEIMQELQRKEENKQPLVA